MYNSKLIGKKIKEIRKSKNISQEKLAEMVSMNTRSILRLENAQSSPTLETLEKVAEALNVDIKVFFETETLESRNVILQNINTALNGMSDSELKTFYKAVYNFIN